MRHTITFIGITVIAFQGSSTECSLARADASLAVFREWDMVGPPCGVQPYIHRVACS